MHTDTQVQHLGYNPAAPLQDQVAWITGGGRGIGLGLAKRFGLAGARLALVDLDQQAGEQALAELEALNLEARLYPCDVTQEEQVEQCLQQAKSDFGRLDMLVNNAGVDGQQQRLEATETSNWRSVQRINLDGVFYGLKYGLPHLQEQQSGVVLNMASIAGQVAFDNISAYSAAKAGVLALTRTAALENAAQGIRVNALAPSVVKTDLVLHFIQSAEDPEAMRQLIENLNPLPGMVTVEAVAEAALYLCSPASAFVTGVELPVDGGYTIR